MKKILMIFAVLVTLTGCFEVPDIVDDTTQLKKNESPVVLCKAYGGVGSADVKSENEKHKHTLTISTTCKSGKKFQYITVLNK